MLDQNETAFITFHRSHKIIITVLVILFSSALIVDWHTTLLVLFSVATLIYFADLVFNSFLIFYGMSGGTGGNTGANTGEIHINEKIIAELPDEAWPMYTILCPLYHEGKVIPQFIKAMNDLDYPRDQLQILLLLEEDDIDTLAVLRGSHLPDYFETIIVPHSKPKTKPKAMNYSLKNARGEYLVIYDAEDIPDPLQLKKAVMAFDVAKEKTICIQAKLNFYNPRQNMLTRAFTAEYSLLFDLILPGLQALNAPIPLGGTSNHFKTAKLRELGGWDAYNVTEDCDLGMRLAKHGYRTEIVDSTTYEEANSDFYNWYKQRSRWVKGYIQTYFVHMRQPFDFIRNGKFLDFLSFQMVVGGKIFSMFLNPFMWLLTIAYFVFRTVAGPVVESLFPTPILYIGMFSLVVGNFIYIYSYMIGCVKRGYTDLVKYVFVVPLYWLAMSAAAWRALYEVFARPHYWSKTAHGLHLPRRRITAVLVEASP